MEKDDAQSSSHSNNISAQDKAKLAHYESLYRGQPPRDQIEAQLLNGQSVNSYGKDGLAPLHRCFKYAFNRDDFYLLCQRLLLKGAQPDLPTIPRYGLPSITLLERIRDLSRMSDNFLRFVNFLIPKLFYFGVQHRYPFELEALYDEESIKERIKKLRRAIDDKNIDEALLLINKLKPVGKAIADDLNQVLRLAIGRGLRSLIEPLIDAGAYILFAIPTIEGILLQPNLSDDNQKLYLSMKLNLLEFIGSGRWIPKKYELARIIGNDDVRSFHLTRHMLSHDDSDPHSIIHLIAWDNSIDIFQSISHETAMKELLNLPTNDARKLTAIQLAALRSNHTILELLIRAGGDIHVRHSDDTKITIGDNSFQNAKSTLVILRILLEAES